MTTEAYPGPEEYTVNGTGPYSINHEYTQNAIKPRIVIDGAETELDASDYSLSAASGDSGNLTLTTAAAATHDGRQIKIYRETAIEQGWAGANGRERGVESQLDRTVQGVQEATYWARRGLRTTTAIPPIDLSGQNDITIIWKDGRFQFGPTVNEVENAQGYAVAAKTARDKAEQWAEEDENTEVEAGKYSAKHHAAKAEGSAGEAATSETNAGNAASSAASSASSASGSASAADMSATNAANSASAAGTSETNAGNAASSAASSASSASGSADAAETSATNAASSASAASGFATAAENSADEAKAAFVSFDDKYLGEKASDPASNNNDEPLQTGAIYWNSADEALRVYNGSAWVDLVEGALLEAELTDRTAVKNFTEVRPEQYGAIIDGITGTSTAMNAAMSALNQAGGGVLRLTDGATYILDDTVLLYPSVTLRGAATLKRKDAGGVFDMFGLGAEGGQIRLDGVTLDGNRDNQSADDEASAIMVLSSGSTSGPGGDEPSSTDFTLQNCIIKGWSYGGQGIHVKGFRRARAIDCFFEDGGAPLYHAIYFLRVSDAIVARNQFGEGIKGQCIKVQVKGNNGDRAIVASNVGQSGLRAVFLSDVSDHIVMANDWRRAPAISDTDAQGIVINQVEDTGGEKRGVVGLNVMAGWSDTCFRMDDQFHTTVFGNIWANAPTLVSMRDSRHVQSFGNQYIHDDMTNVVGDGAGGFEAVGDLDLIAIDFADGDRTIEKAFFEDRMFTMSVSPNSSTAVRTNVSGGEVVFGGHPFVDMADYGTIFNELDQEIIKLDNQIKLSDGDDYNNLPLKSTFIGHSSSFVSSSNNPFSNNFGSAGFQSVVNENRIAQIAVAVQDGDTTPRMAFRAKDADWPSRWSEVYHKDNLVGTVSEDGSGSVTGGAFETYTDGGIRVRKTADGEMTMLIKNLHDDAIPAGTSVSGTVSLPENFVNASFSVFPSARRTAAAADCENVAEEIRAAAVAVTAGSVGWAMHAEGTYPSPARLDLLLIGQWK